jgi:hypothetical protein
MQNIVILAGNIGQKPEVRSTQSGTKITNFTLATSRPRLSEGRVIRDENGYRVMDTEWHRITCFNCPPSAPMVACCRFRGHEDKIVTKELECGYDETEV